MPINEYFPTTSGTYIAENGKLICLIRIVGWYPTLIIKRCMVINSFMDCENNPIASCSKQDVINSICYDRGKWIFTPLPCHFDYGQYDPQEITKLIIPDYVLQELYQKYINMIENGIPFTKMVSVIKTRFACSSDFAVNLINKFDNIRYGKDKLF